MKYSKALKFFKEQTNSKYIEEEVVNSINQPMTKREIRKRDSKVPNNARVIKGPPGRKDTPKEAQYRLATYIALRGKRRKKKENK